MNPLPALFLPLFVALQEPAPKPAPAPEDPAADRLERSPRHHEWIVVESDGREVHAFVAFPEVAEKAPVVVVIHENKGLTDWVRSVADELAEAGYVAIAPDLLSGEAPGGGRTEDFESVDAATRALYARPSAEVMADLEATADRAARLPAAADRLFVAGFCWGGARAFDMAAVREDLAAAFVFYGSSLEPEAMARVECPVYGFYGENDARITSTVEATAEAMAARDKSFVPEIYPGAGHGFLRTGAAADGSEADRAAHDQAWERWKRLLAEPD